MTKPIIAEKSPIKVAPEPGTHFWCACGASKNQPYCDGSHKGSGFSPVAFKIVEKKEIWLCRCKHTGNPPYCDGTHRTL